MNLTSILQQAGRHQWNPAIFDIPLFLPGGFVLLWCWFWSSYFKVFKGGQQPLSPTCLAGDLSLQPTGEHRGEATTELPAAEKWGLWVQKPFSEVRNLPGFASSSPWKSLGWVMSPWATPSTVSSSSVHHSETPKAPQLTTIWQQQQQKWHSSCLKDLNLQFFKWKPFRAAVGSQCVPIPLSSEIQAISCSLGQRITVFHPDLKAVPLRGTGPQFSSLQCEKLITKITAESITCLLVAGDFK